MTSATCAAVILAGGAGRRLGGVSKATLEVGGVRLIDRIATALAEIDGKIVVALGAHSAEMLSLPRGVVPVPDPPGWYGPLAGIAAAALCIDQLPLLSVAVDSALLPPIRIADWMAALGTADVVVARYGGNPYYTNALWSRRAVDRLVRVDPAVLKRGGIRGVVHAMDLAWLDWQETAAGDPFLNINTPADLEYAEQRLAQIGVGKGSQTR